MTTLALNTPSEHQEQATLINWAKKFKPNWLIVHVENEYNPKSNQKKRYELGFIMGWPDLLVVTPNKTIYFFFH